MPQSARWTNKDERAAYLLNPAWGINRWPHFEFDYYPNRIPSTLKSHEQVLQHVLELAMCGDKLAIKALRIVTTKNVATYGQYRPLVEALEKEYGQK